MLPLAFGMILGPTTRGSDPIDHSELPTPNASRAVSTLCVNGSTAKPRRTIRHLRFEAWRAAGMDLHGYGNAPYRTQEVSGQTLWGFVRSVTTVSPVLHGQTSEAASPPQSAFFLTGLALGICEPVYVLDVRWIREQHR